MIKADRGLGRVLINFLNPIVKFGLVRKIDLKFVQVRLEL